MSGGARQALSQETTRATRACERLAEPKAVAGSARGFLEGGRISWGGGVSERDRYRVALARLAETARYPDHAIAALTLEPRRAGVRWSL
jgi:hypothetical protein